GPDAPKFDKTIFANADKSWRITLPPLKAGGPYTIVLKGRKSEVRMSNVMVGDVWVCAGESNMEWPLSLTQDAARYISEASHSNIRLLTVPKVVAAAPAQTVESRWLECTPQSAGAFSAVAYFFGRDLQRTLNVPIGLVHVSFGGTVAEAWT